MIYTNQNYLFFMSKLDIKLVIKLNKIENHLNPSIQCGWND